jgi:hypothetical protein
MKQPQLLPDVVEFLAGLGVHCYLADPEGEELGIDVRDLSAGELRTALLECSGPIRGHLEYQRHRRMRVLVGGPRAGQPHRRGSYASGIVAFHEGPRRWAVYEIVRGDDRAWFRGWATSEKNGKALKLLPREPRPKTPKKPSPEQKREE